MPGRRKKNFKKNLRNAVIERYTLGSTEMDPSFPMPSGEDNDDEAAKEAAVSQRAKRVEEQQKYGIYFDDDYDYMQHLKDVEDISRSEMKELVVLDPKSDDEYQVSRMAAANFVSVPKPEIDPDWDPEVMAALDEEFDFDDPDNVLDDDFMDLANPGDNIKPVKDEGRLAKNFHDVVNIGSEKAHMFNADEEEDNDEADDSDADSTAMELGDDDDEWTDEDEDDDKEDDKKTSCSEFFSSALPRNKQLQLLDAQTKAVLQREYTEDQIGALDFEELNGRVTFDSDLFKQTVKEIHDAKSVVTLKDIVDSPDRVRPVIPESWKYVEERGEDEDYEDEEEERQKRHERALSPKKPQWDCVSILSTLSNTKNIPKTVVWPSPESEKKRKKNPSESTNKSDEKMDTTRGLTLRELEQQMRTERLADAPSTYRPSGETSEERRERKQAVKEHKRERRAEKKANKLAFRTEMQRQTKMVQVREVQEKMVSLHVPN